MTPVLVPLLNTHAKHSYSARMTKTSCYRCATRFAGWGDAAPWAYSGRQEWCWELGGRCLRQLRQDPRSGSRQQRRGAEYCNLLVARRDSLFIPWLGERRGVFKEITNREFGRVLKASLIRCYHRTTSLRVSMWRYAALYYHQTFLCSANNDTCTLEPAKPTGIFKSLWFPPNCVQKSVCPEGECEQTHESASLLNTVLPGKLNDAPKKV